VPLFVNARTDVYFLPAQHADRSFGEAARRLEQYAAAGADGVFVPGLVDTGEIAKLVARVPLPVNVYAGYAGVPPIAELAAAGVRRISVGCGPLQGLLGQAEAMARELRHEGRYDAMLEGALSAASVDGLP